MLTHIKAFLTYMSTYELDVLLLGLLVFLVATNVVIWVVHKDTLISIYDSPYLFDLSAPPPALSPHAGDDGTGSSNRPEQQQQQKQFKRGVGDANSSSVSSTLKVPGWGEMPPPTLPWQGRDDEDA